MLSKISVHTAEASAVRSRPEQAELAHEPDALRACGDAQLTVYIPRVRFHRPQADVQRMADVLV